MQPADLSEADWSALIMLRRLMWIRIDEAGRHAESLTRLATADLILLEDHTTAIRMDDVTEVQRALGFKPGPWVDGIPPAGKRLADAPTWFWPTPFRSYESQAPELLREREGRDGADIDWDAFCTYVTRSYGRCNAYPSVAKVAKKFGCKVEDVIDWVDGRMWAFRCGAEELAEQHVELEGE